MPKKINLKVLFIKLSSLFLFVSSVYCQSGAIYICEGIDKNNNFVGDDVTKVNTNFIWYFMRDDLQSWGFDEGEVIYKHIPSGKTERYKFVCDPNGKAGYFEDRLERGRYVISINVRGVILGKSKEFEVR